jgi:glycosyltransferase involved in cell wall biosynthesis
MNNHRKIAVLLCTYNGTKYIRKQIDSIINQTEVNWTIFASDDGSTDDTVAILSEYQSRLGEDRLIIIKGPGKGFAWNFINLLEASGNEYSHYAFSDQDDEWHTDKLARGLLYLDKIAAEIPAVHCGRTLLVDENDKEIGYSPLFQKTPSFKNALIQSIAGGNTMMLNNSARSIIIKTPRWYEIVSHDWWIYILITGCDGKVFYDEKPTINYRQHTDNIVGSNMSWLGRIQRISGLLDGKFRVWIQKNLDAMAAMDIPLSKENKNVLALFSRARNASFVERVLIFCKLKMYRQTLFGTIALFIAIILKKI